MRKRILNKKGITIAEAVVAMTVIAIVTVTALSIITSSTLTAKKAAHIAEAQDFSLSALECFRASDDKDAFFGLIDFVGGCTDEITEDENKYILTLENSGYSAYITLDYSDTDSHKFSVEVKDGENAVTDKIEFTKASKGGGE